MTKQKQPTKNKQLLLRNLVWNKHFTNEITEQEPKKYIPIAKNLLEELRCDPRINYCLFTIERGKKQNKSSFHIQGYLEFKDKLDAIAFNKKHQFTDIQNRKGSQQQAIDYVKKTETKIDNELYTFGIPKKQLYKYNLKDEDIPKDMDLQRILLHQRIKDNHYKTFQDICEDFELLFLKNEKWCKNLWDKYHPIKVIDAEPIKTIWLYGHSGIGKTYWTNNYLKDNGYEDKDICRKSYEGIDKVWFDLTDEDKKVLWLEEVREDFPNHNKLIKIIDRKDFLPVKGSQIKNTFEVLIINSLHSPQKVYRELKIGNQIEVLRRLYLGKECKVYELIPNLENHNELIDKTNELPNALKNHVERHEKLIELEGFKEELLRVMKYLKENDIKISDYYNKTLDQKIQNQLDYYKENFEKESLQSIKENRQVWLADDDFKHYELITDDSNNT